LQALDELLARYPAQRESGERFGDFVIRTGIVRPVLDPKRDFHE
jgi:sulfite reductase (NADPH) hemoprotein beta-component